MRRLAAALAVVAGWTACTAFDDAVLPVHVEPVTTTDAGMQAEAGCARAFVSNEGPNRSDGTGGEIEVVVAVQKISLGIVNNKLSPTFGYDLDMTCGPSCQPRGDAGAPVDGELGRDDALGALVAKLGFVDPTAYANPAFATGDLGIVVRIQGYNGLPNDDEITFSLYRSPGTGGGKPDFTNPNQAWQIDSTDLEIGAAPYTAITSSTGFVKNGQLVVAELASSKIPFNGDSDIKLQQVSFTGDLKKDDALGRWRLDNALGVGRWPVADAVQTVAHVQDPMNSRQRICKNPLVMDAAKQFICSSADLNIGTGQVCNALSAAVEFDTVPAALGAMVTPLREDACAGTTIPNCD